MLGAIIGDIVGSRYEFSPTNDYNFEMFAPGSDFTDDTVCTVAVADAILRGRDYGESLHEWCRRHPYPMGSYGGRFAQWVRSDSPQPYNSFGNGSAMRVSPVAWLFGADEVMVEAGKSAACTHNHPAGIQGAQAVAVAISDCLEIRKKRPNATPEEILERGLDSAVRFYAPHPEDFRIDLERHRNVFDETCQGTVPVALWIVMQSSGFEDAIRRAVSLGADADTLGAIVGSIAEAVWGIPQWMEKKAMEYLTAEMADVVRTFRSSFPSRQI